MFYHVLGELKPPWESFDHLNGFSDEILGSGESDEQQNSNDNNDVFTFESGNFGY